MWLTRWRSPAFRVSFVRARIEELLERVGLADLAQRAARRLSGGEQQRLALARALARDPELLLLDEPTANLDPAAARSVEQIIVAAAQSGIKVVMASHDLGQIRRLAGDVVFLVRGSVCEHCQAGDFLSQSLDARGRRISARRTGDMIELNRSSLMHARFFSFVRRAWYRGHGPRRALAGAGSVHRGGINDLDAGFRTVRVSAADFQSENRYRREGDRPRHGTGARHRAARRRGCGLRPCQSAGGEVSGRGVRRQALRRDVQ